MAGTIPLVPTHPADPYASMVQSMRRDYPLIANIPFSVGRGSGPYESEVYEPWVKDSPTPGQFYIQLRHYLDQPRKPDDIRRLLTGEMMHYLGNIDPRTNQPVNPQWYALKQQYRQALQNSPRDWELAHDRYQDELREAQGSGEKPRSFDDFLNESYLDQHIGGTMFPLSDPQWREWQVRAQNLPRVAPQQSAVIERMRQLLTTGR